jgi:hypothetical protein
MTLPNAWLRAATPLFADTAAPSNRSPLRWGILALAALLGTGCERHPVEPTPREQAALARHVQRFEAARTFGIAEAAELYAAEILRRFPSSEESATLRAQWLSLQQEAAARRAEKQRAALWRYNAAEHPRGLELLAELTADAQDATPTLRVALRRHPRWGESAYLLIGDGADFACALFCTLHLVFDGESRPFAVKRALDNVPPALFMRDHAAFYAAIETSQELRLDLPLASGRRAAYRFDVGGYQPAQMAQLR